MQNTAEPASGYLLCTAPRSGSTLLCTLLRATKVAGWPESYFHGPDLAQWARGLDLPESASFEDIVAATLKEGRAGGQIFAGRQQWPSMPLLLRTLRAKRPEATDRARLEGTLGPLRYIHLSRPDKLGQAISLLRAQQTGIWHRHADGSIYEEKSPSRASGYDAAAITAQIAEFESHDAHWRRWFDEQRITPLTLTYDTLAADPVATLREVLTFLGLDPTHADGVTAPTQKLADTITDDRAARYRSETAR